MGIMQQLFIKNFVCYIALSNDFHRKVMYILELLIRRNRSGSMGGCRNNRILTYTSKTPMPMQPYTPIPQTTLAPSPPNLSVLTTKIPPCRQLPQLAPMQSPARVAKAVKKTTTTTKTTSSTPAPPRKLMVVADPTRESAGALQWALSHATLDHDEIILLHVETAGQQTAASSSRRSSIHSFLKRTPTNTLSSGAGASSSAYSRGDGGSDISSSSALSDFLEEMRAKCEETQPKVHVSINRVEMVSGGKAATILALSDMLSVDLLVIGQRRSSSTTAFLR